MRALLLSLLLLAACSATREAADHSSAAPAPRWPDLAGNWTGSADVPGQGHVTAMIVADGDGTLLAVASAGGVSVRETLRIEAWDGRTLRVARAAESLDVPATLSGDALTIWLPGAGDVTLRRSR